MDCIVVELLNKILVYIPLKDIYNVSLVNKKFLQSLKHVNKYGLNLLMQMYYNFSINRLITC